MRKILFYFGELRSWISRSGPQNFTIRYYPAKISRAVISTGPGLNMLAGARPGITTFDIATHGDLPVTFPPSFTYFKYV